MEHNKRSFFSDLLPKFRAEPDIYGLIARASIMLEYYANEAIAKVWPNVSFPKRIRIDFSERIELVRSLNVWPNDLCKMVIAFNAVRNKVMHRIDFNLDSIAFADFFALTDLLVRYPEVEEEDSPSISVSGLDSIDGLCWVLSRHVSALLAWIEEIDVGLFEKSLTITRKEGDPYNWGSWGITIEFGGVPIKSTSFSDELRQCVGITGEASFAILSRFSTFRDVSSDVISIIQNRRWSDLLQRSSESYPVFNYVYAVKSATNVTVVVVRERRDLKSSEYENFSVLSLEHLDKSDAERLVNLLQNDAWRNFP